MEIISHKRAAAMVRNAGPKLVGLTFTKRSNGKPRIMVARGGVRKGVKGKSKEEYNKQKAQDIANGLLRLCEFVSVRDDGSNSGNLMPPMRSLGTQFRCVPIDGITELRTGGKVYTVK